MSNNTELWDKLKRVPKEHLKGFKRAGGFTGTAIKPMWTFHRMTEEFGPCGAGWGVDAPVFNVQPAGNEILVYCTTTVWYRLPLPPPNLSQGELYGDIRRVVGVGGDKILTVGQNGPRTDDEAFKKAFTDAVTNALKMIGAGADIHMGLWDGNKYVDEKPEKKDKAGPHSPNDEIERDVESETGHLNGTPGASKAQARTIYETLVATMRITATREAQKEWLKLNRAAIDNLPADWMSHFDDAYQAHREALEARAP